MKNNHNYWTGQIKKNRGIKALDRLFDLYTMRLATEDVHETARWTDEILLHVVCYEVPEDLVREIERRAAYDLMQRCSEWRNFLESRENFLAELQERLLPRVADVS